MWKHVYSDFSDLSKSEQLSLFLAIKDALFPEEREGIAKRDLYEKIYLSHTTRQCVSQAIKTIYGTFSRCGYEIFGQIPILVSLP